MKVSSLKKQIESTYSILDDPFHINQPIIEVGSEKEMGREQSLKVKDAFTTFLDDEVIKPYSKQSTNLTKLRFLITSVIDDYTWESLIEPIVYDKLEKPKKEDFEKIITLFITGKTPAVGALELDESTCGSILSAIISTITNRKSSIYDDFTITVLRRIVSGIKGGSSNKYDKQEEV